MEIHIERKTFLEGIQQVQSVVERKSTSPILSHVLLETKNTMLSLTATDREISIETLLPASITKPGSITLSAQKLFEILKELPESSVHLSTQENHWVVLKCQNSTFRLAGLPKIEFPELPSVKSDESFDLESPILREMITKTSFAISHDPNRNALTGSLFHTDNDRLSMVSTDGHRLAVITKEIPKDSALKNFEVIIPFKTVMEVKKLCDSSPSTGKQEGAEAQRHVPVLNIGFGNNQIIFSKENTTLISRLIDAQFPDYKQVIPRTSLYHISMNKEAFHRAVRRVSLLSNEKSRLIKFTISPGLLHLTSFDPELGEAREELSVEYSGDEVVIGFNAKYISEFLSVIEGETLHMEFNDPLSPGLFTSPEEKDFQCVIMPMRV
ncbi:MAG TPA: DNA polymerase III subunit beta [Candidatus Limnocylindrales bacterium]|nr:DNA polymerase III subunit beta [Candidatus Limnocylindrales bacterium]